MDQNKLRDYARLLALKGVNVQKGDEVWVYCGLDQPDFINMVVEELYKAGCELIRVERYDPRLGLYPPEP